MAGEFCGPVMNLGSCPSPLQLQGGTARVGKCQELLPGGISELRSWALATSSGRNTHPARPTAVCDRRGVTAEMRCQAAGPFFTLSPAFFHQPSPRALCAARRINAVTEHRGWIHFFFLRCDVSRSGRRCSGTQKLVLLSHVLQRKEKSALSNETYSFYESRQSIRNYTKYSCLNSLFA